MAKQFDTEVRETFDKKYLKVFIRDISKIEDVRTKVSSLSSVKNANITENQSDSNSELTLTVYSNKVYDIEETKKEVEIMLEEHFNGTSTIVEE
jgi:hypothetical protein